jgi:hypothetical protein
VARSYLAPDSIDLSFQPAFRDQDRTKASLALFISKQRNVVVPPKVRGAAGMRRGGAASAGGAQLQPGPRRRPAPACWQPTLAAVPAARC